jgi:hypothetical protein
MSISFVTRVQCFFPILLSLLPDLSRKAFPLTESGFAGIFLYYPFQLYTSILGRQLLSCDLHFDLWHIEWCCGRRAFLFTVLQLHNSVK